MQEMDGAKDAAGRAGELCCVDLTSIHKNPPLCKSQRSESRAREESPADLVGSFHALVS